MNLIENMITKVLTPEQLNVYNTSGLGPVCNGITMDNRRSQVVYNKDRLVDNIIHQDTPFKQLVYLFKYLAHDIDDAIGHRITTVLMDPHVKQLTHTVDTENAYATSFQHELSKSVKRASIRCTCGSLNTVSKSIQTRSTDEAEELRIHCSDCGYTFSDGDEVSFEVVSTV